MAKASVISQAPWKGPVYIVPLGWGLTVTFVLLFVICFLAALLFPNASLAHNWLGLFSTKPVGSAGQLVEGVIWNAVFAWIAAVIFGPVYNARRVERAYGVPAILGGQRSSTRAFAVATVPGSNT